MGLDMYLSRKFYVKNWSHNQDRQFTVKAEINGQPIPTIQQERISYVEEEVMYWRKANAIHGWFVDKCGGGVDECQPISVSSEDLRNLRDAIENVLKDPTIDVAEENDLAPQSGFFFGSVEMDEWYLESLKETKEVISELLNDELNIKACGMYEPEYIYQASW